MKNTKKSLALLLITCLLLGLTACGNSGNSGDSAAPDASAETADSTGAQEETAAPSDGEKVTVRIAYENNPGEPLDLACNEWKRLIEERSNGTMEVALYPSSQLGSKTDLIDQIQMGEGIICFVEGSFLAEYGAPEMGILSAPYMYENWDQCWKLVESDWFKEQCDLLSQEGLHILTANWAYGVRELMTTKPVRTVDDLKGMIIRTPNNILQMKTLEAMGAAPTAMALSDVYTATQQGTIDGMENPMATLYGQAYYEVAQYITMIDYIMMPTQWATSETWFNSLTPEQQQILTESGDEAGIFNNQKQEEMIEQYTADMEAQGVELIYPDEAEQARFKEAVMQIYDNPDVTGAWRDGLYEYIMDIIK